MYRMEIEETIAIADNWLSFKKMFRKKENTKTH